MPHQIIPPPPEVDNDSGIFPTQYWTDESMAAKIVEDSLLNKMASAPKQPKKPIPKVYPKVLMLIRGWPGTGKSTLAEWIKAFRNKLGYSAVHFEADQFFITGQGEYVWDATKLAQAHAYCQDQVASAMAHENRLIIVSNTFIAKSHLMPYLRLAREHGYVVQEIICKGVFENIHDVPPATIRKMQLNFEF